MIISAVRRKLLLRGTVKKGLTDSFVTGYPPDVQQTQNEASDRIIL